MGHVTSTQCAEAPVVGALFVSVGTATVEMASHAQVGVHCPPTGILL